MPDWLDSWTNTRYLNQQALAKRWSNRGSPVADEPVAVIPAQHSFYILKHGKKAYRGWLQAGCPDREAPLVCPAMAAIVEFFVQQRYGVWKPRQPDAPPPS